MAKKRRNIPRVVGQEWSQNDRQAFADRNILRAQTIPNKRKEANKKACRNFRSA